MSIFAQQRSVKPTPEEMIPLFVNDDQQQAALDFIAYIRACKMKPTWVSGNSWAYKYKNKRVGYFKINSDGNWVLWLFTQKDSFFREFILNEPNELKQYALENITKKTPCGGCMPYLNRRAVNEDFENMCSGSNVYMENPNENLVELAKRLIALRREAISNNRIPKCTYLKPADRA